MAEYPRLSPHVSKYIVIRDGLIPRTFGGPRGIQWPSRVLFSAILQWFFFHFIQLLFTILTRKGGKDERVSTHPSDGIMGGETPIGENEFPYIGLIWGRGKLVLTDIN